MIPLGILLIIIGAVYGTGTGLFSESEEETATGLIIAFVFLVVGLFCLTNSIMGLSDLLPTFDQSLP